MIEKYIILSYDAIDALRTEFSNLGENVEIA